MSTIISLTFDLFDLYNAVVMIELNFFLSTFNPDSVNPCSVHNEQ